MDSLYLLKIALEAIIQDSTEYRDEIATAIFTGKVEDTALVIGNLKELYVLAVQAERHFAKLRRDCAEGIAFLRGPKFDG